MQIAIISGKGGTGKSSITAAFASIEKNVVLADCDVDASNLYLLFTPTHNEERAYVGAETAIIDNNLCISCMKCWENCRFDAISYVNQKINISDVACDGCGLCARICPTQAIMMQQHDKSRLYSGSFRYGKMVYGVLAPGEENSGKLVNEVRSKANIIATENDLAITLIDGPPGIGCPVISAIANVDGVVLVTEPTLSGFHDLKRIKEIADNFRLPACVIINKFTINEKISSEIEAWCKKEKVNFAGKIPFDLVMVEAMTQLKTIIEYQPNGTITKKLKEIYNYIKLNINKQTN
ncbi:MAG TPA: P-loop NTPase [Bacteroidales bacterium]|jgi:MinD superfamily P-loop ATPase|nr:P-loop NTPase [Bacteroidales bacterium]